jgi:hypothetical protein
LLGDVIGGEAVESPSQDLPLPRWQATQQWQQGVAVLPFGDGVQTWKQRRWFRDLIDRALLNGSDPPGKLSGCDCVGPGSWFAEVIPTLIDLDHGVLSNVSCDRNRGPLVDQETNELTDIFTVERGEFFLCLSSVCRPVSLELSLMSGWCTREVHAV